MKRIVQFLILIGIIVLFAGCAATGKTISYKDSNAWLLQENIRNMDITEITDKIDKNERIVLVSTETEESGDNYFNAMIEDVLMEKLVDAGFTILERDDDLIYRLMSESTANYTHFTRHKKELSASSHAAGGLRGYSLDSKKKSSSILKSNYISGDRLSETENFDSAARYDTELLSSDKILAYRILENGIIYEKNAENINDIERKATAVLSMRLENANTGEVLLVRNMENETTDTISSSDKKLLEKYHFKNYPFAYPRVYGNPNDLAKEKTQLSKTNAPLIIAGTAVAILIVTILVSEEEE